MPCRTGTLLCVANYPSNTGYAWDFIEGLYAGLASRLALEGIQTFVGYPRIDEAPRTLRNSSARPVELDVSLRTMRSVRDVAAFVRRERVAVLYLTDRPARSVAFAALRAAGVRSIIVHDHASGQRSRPTGPWRWAKWAIGRVPWIVADRVIAVSDYVARRQVESGLIPRARVTRVWNGIAVEDANDVRANPIREVLGIGLERPVVACACRAAPEKGVSCLLEAFDIVAARWPAGPPRPALVYIGDGPAAGEIRRTHSHLRFRDDVLLTGYRRDAADLIAGSDVCAMPSLWEDALPLAVMQPMAMGRPVVASAVGGIPEMVVDGETGLLVPPGDREALAAAIERLLRHPDLARQLGQAARDRVAAHFTPAMQMDALTAIVLDGFGRAAGALTRT